MRYFIEVLQIMLLTGLTMIQPSIAEVFRWRPCSPKLHCFDFRESRFSNFAFGRQRFEVRTCHYPSTVRISDFRLEKRTSGAPYGLVGIIAVH